MLSVSNYNSNSVLCASCGEETVDEAENPKKIYTCISDLNKQHYNNLQHSYFFAVESAFYTACDLQPNSICNICDNNLKDIHVHNANKEKLVSLTFNGKIVVLHYPLLENTSDDNLPNTQPCIKCDEPISYIDGNIVNEIYTCVQESHANYFNNLMHKQIATCPCYTRCILQTEPICEMCIYGVKVMIELRKFDIIKLTDVNLVMLNCPYFNFSTIDEAIKKVKIKNTAN